METCIRFAALIVLVGLAGRVPSADRPNVVLILADDLGYGDLGCYGCKDIRTPNIDKLARSGARLTECYSAAPVCTPTRAALITGRYPQRTGFEWVIRYTEKDKGLSPNEGGLAKWLKAAGYDTAVFGKWHLGYKPEFSPIAHGFDRFFGFPGADVDYYSHKDALGDPSLYEQDKLIDQPGYLTDLITDRAVTYIGERRDRPFFLFVSYNAPHWPFQRPDNPDDIRTKDNYGPETGTRADYAAMVERMDRGVGAVLAELDRRGLLKNSLVVFTSDNGGERFSDNGQLFHSKYTLWEGGIRVPGIACWPGRIPAGFVCQQPVITMDWTATILALAGAKPDRPLDGIDVFREISTNAQLPDRDLYWRLPRPEAKHGMKAVRRGNWKLVQDRELDLLFNLATDPGERINLAHRQSGIVRELKTALDKWESSLPTVK